MAFVAIVRLRVADVPLERDEGEYAYAGRLILQGIPPYQLAYNMKFPGMYYAYAAIMAVGGQTVRGIHLGLMLVNAATILLVFAVGRRLMGPFPGAIAAAAFAVLSLDRWIMGVFAHATHFVLLPAMAGLLVLLWAMDSKRWGTYLGTGFLLGTAVLMKQHAMFFLLLGAVLIVSNDLREGTRSLGTTVTRVALLAAGSAIPVAGIAGLFLAQGVLSRFWFWTFRYAKEYVSQVPLRRAIPNLLESVAEVTRANLFLWLLAGAGLLALWLPGWSGRARVFLTGLLVGSFLAVCPGFYFRNHYFILLLPAAALLAGVAVGSLDGLLGRVMSPRAARVAAVTLFAALATHYVVTERDYLFSWSPHQLSRIRYGSNPFPEAVEIARYLKERTDAADRIAVLGSEPEIYFYADRISATGYIYMYPLMEVQPFARKMQEEMIRQIEAAHPKYLVFVQIMASWLPRKESNQTIVEWGNRYVAECYEQVGVADIHTRDTMTCLFDEDARGYTPRSQSLLYTFRRKSDAPCGVVKPQ